MIERKPGAHKARRRDRFKKEGVTDCTEVLEKPSNKKPWDLATHSPGGRISTAE